MTNEEAKKIIVQGLHRITAMPHMQGEWQLWEVQDFIGKHYGKDKEKEFADICIWRDLGRMNNFLRWL